MKSFNSDKTCKATISNALKISDCLYIGDPCYTADDPGCLGFINNALPGWWNYYVKLDSTLKRPCVLEIRHSSTSGNNLHYKNFGIVGIDSGQVGIYDKTLRDMIGTNHEFYPVVCRGTERQVMTFNYRGLGVVCSTLYGDGYCSAFIAEQNKKVVAVKIRLD